MLSHLRIHFPGGTHYLILERTHDEIDHWLMNVLHYPEMNRSRKEVWVPESEDIARIGRRLGWVPHSLPVLFFFETVKEEIAAAFTAANNQVEGNDSAMDQTLSLIHRLELTHLKDRQPFSLSEGESKLVWFLCQWAKNPEYFIIENFFSGLASDYSNRLLSFIQETSQRNDRDSIFCPTFLIGHPDSDSVRIEKNLSKPFWIRMTGFPSDK